MGILARLVWFVWSSIRLAALSSLLLAGLSMFHRAAEPTWGDYFFFPFVFIGLVIFALNVVLSFMERLADEYLERFHNTNELP